MRRGLSIHSTLVRWVAACILALLLLPSPRPVKAHPADMYGQVQAITFSNRGLEVAWRIIPGPILADSIWQAAGPDANGSISDAHAQSWIAPFVSDFSVQIDGRSAGKYQLADVHWPGTVDVLRTGEDAISFSLEYDWPAALTGSHALSIHNAHFEANSLNSFSLSAQDGWSFGQPSQNGGLLQTVLFSPRSPSPAPGSSGAQPSQLASWSSGTPNLPDFTTAVSRLALSISSPPEPPAAPTPSIPASSFSSVTAALTGLVKTNQFSPFFLVGALLLSLALGTLHALTPGHGKALVGAYLVGSRGRTRDAVFLGTIVTATHTGSVLLLGLVTLFAAHYVLPALIVPWLEVASGLLVIAFGVNLFLRRGADLSAWLSKTRALRDPAHEHHFRVGTHGHSHGPAGSEGLVHAGDPYHGQAHGGDEDHPHSHEPQVRPVTFKSLLALGISGGLVPCPDAIAILLVAVAVNRIPFGMLLIVAFSIGLALVLIGIGIAMVHGVRLIARSDLVSRFAIYTPVISAIVVSGLGGGLTWSALNSLRFAAAVSKASSSAPFPAATAPASSAFDLQTARLLYVAADSQGWDQLFTQPLLGGSSLQYTREPSGITGYSVSPDRKLIAYTSFDGAGGSMISALDVDGSHLRVLLTCPQAECDAPRWYPDDQRLIYERLDESSSVTVPRFSIWWLDASTGTTQPVFPDPAFASLAPAFSPDGAELAYISTADNMLVVYRLKDGRSQSVPLGTQSVLPPVWSPLGDSVLFGNQAQEASPVQIKLYSLAAAHVSDLGGPPAATDYSAVWSPDGKWIAIDRDLPGGSGQNSNQIWLVRPDGSQAHVLLAEPGGSYSSLSWSPDGRYLLYSRYALANPSDPRGRFDAYLTDTQSGTSRLLIAGADIPSFVP